MVESKYYYLKVTSNYNKIHSLLNFAILFFRMRVDIMRFPQYSDFFSDPPFGFDIFHRRRQNYDDAVREIPVQFDPCSSVRTCRQNRATDNRSPFSDFDPDIPEDFWKPVIRQENNITYRSNSNKKLKKDRKQSEETNSAFLYLSDDESSDINNSGVSTKSRRKSLSRSKKSHDAKAEEFSSSIPGTSAGSLQTEGKTEIKKPKIGVSHKTEEELEKACDYKSTLETGQSKAECIEVDSLEEAIDYQDLCDFFGCDRSIAQPEKPTKNSSSTNIRPTPSYPAYDIIRTILKKENRCIDYIEGDGNCFFRSFSKVIYGSESCHSELRQAVVDLLEKFPREFEQFIDGSVHEHIKSMRKLGTWATQTEIYVAATLLQRDVYVLSPDHTGEVYRWLLFSPRFSYKEASVYDRCYLTLCHTNGNHYDRIASVDKNCNCGVPPPRMMGIQGAVDLTKEVV